MTAHPAATVEENVDLPEECADSETVNSEGQGYSAEELSKYYYDLECLLLQVERAETHYKALGIDYLATTGEITTAYLQATILLDPAVYGLDLELPEELAPKVTLALERLSEGFRVLMDFDEKLAYDSHLFGWENTDSKQKEPRQRRRKSKSKASKPGTKNANRRNRERFQLPIPVEVTSYDKNGTDWHEAVQSVDLSRSGACILLRRRVLVGNVLYLRMPMPTVLRAHEYLDQTYGTYGIVRWIRPPREGFRLVGVQFLGELPPLGFRERPWATFQIGEWDGLDRRAESREEVSEAIEIEYFDESEQLIKKDSAFIEDISTSGVRVCAHQPPLESDLIRIIRPKASLSVFAMVRNRYKERDGYERLCAQFIGGATEGDAHNH